MAYAFRLDDVRMAYIRLSRADLVAEAPGFALRLGGVEHRLDHAVLKLDTVSINDELCQVERILQRAPTRQVTLVVRGAEGVLHEELVLFHHSFFAPFVDYVKAMPVGGEAAKPGLLAAFTHARDDNDMLRFWEAHHARLAGHRNLYVIDHGSAVSPRGVLHPDTNVVPLPRGLTDHADMARFCGHFQRFLLSQYRFVLHTDADELLVPEDGEEALLARLASPGYGGIIQPGHAFDVLHDMRPDTPAEAPLKPGEPVSTQRGVMLPAEGIYKKPVLASIPASWLQGFHLVYEEASVREDPGLWLMHLQSADFGLLLDKNRRWNALRQSEADFARCPQGGRPSDEDSLRRWFVQVLADERLTAIPERLRGKF
ncbi:MAG: hypothetical protein RDU24_13340 [Humidesulfovibrio sp.]|uniref:glycosyltransferase family 2 protein n=1 Tax=Humidesulfovibrio sp. TaxID=2910988 RepID=UPI0027E9F263|nr:glycosyltransferase family 2 protein [Humidesulfovibrio sp.]MDQ7836360.1 hypothetical protein [Humidesulfovibrio sp.]